MGSMDAFISAITDFLTPLPVWDARGETLMPIFGTAHQLWLIICIGMVLLLVSGHRGLAPYPKAQRRFELRVACAPAVLCAIHLGLMAAFGAFHPGCAPLHLCNLAEILAIAYALHGDELTGNVLYGIGIIGPLAALLFPGWTTAPAFSLPAVCGFAEHTLVISYVIMKLRDKSLRPTLEGIWQPLVFTGIYVSAIYPFNKQWETNFAFVNWPLPGTPLEMWEQMYGNPGYIACYALVFVLIEIALFYPWRKKTRQGQP